MVMETEKYGANNRTYKYSTKSFPVFNNLIFLKNKVVHLVSALRVGMPPGRSRVPIMTQSVRPCVPYAERGNSKVTVQPEAV